MMDNSAPVVGNGRKKPNWRSSEEKKLLRRWLEDGTVQDHMGPREIYLMHTGFQLYEYKNFSTNLRNLRKAVRLSQHAVMTDHVAFASDTQRMRMVGPARMYRCELGVQGVQQGRTRAPFVAFNDRTAMTERGYPRWDRSEAKACLKADLDEDLDKAMKPAELHKTRQIYQQFPLKVFRGHIYQERRTRTERMYWKYRTTPRSNSTQISRFFTPVHPDDEDPDDEEQQHDG